MIVASLIFAMLPHQGYWIAGQKQEVEIRRSTVMQLPAARVQWAMMLGGTLITSGSAAMTDGGAHIEIAAPAVRQRTQLSFVYRLIQNDGGKELAVGQTPVAVFPDDLLSRVSNQLGERRAAVWDSSGQLSEVLKSAGVAFARTRDGSSLDVRQYAVVLVDADLLSASPFSQAPLASQAAGGASVMIFAQHGEELALFGYSLAKRRLPARLSWRIEHPLLAGLEQADWESLLADAPDAWTVELPGDEPALELAWWPTEIAGVRAVPLDAMLLTKSVGHGRIVLCQLPLGDWRSDPRSQIFLCSAIDYLLTRPEPTLAPSQRPTTQPVVIQPDVNRILLPGERP